jgi:O-acetyl-ADP-ribose deacetylase (regulator of RNase III)
MKVIKGDLIKLALNGEFDVIVHGCNCFNSMGKGIAKTIKQNFPEAYKADQQSNRGDKNKLGYFTTATVKKFLGDIIIVNAYTQFSYNSKYGKNKCMVDYIAIEDVMKRIKKTFHGSRIGYPKIGAGLGGGDWKIISGIIDRELIGEKHTLVLL